MAEVQQLARQWLVEQGLDHRGGETAARGALKQMNAYRIGLARTEAGHEAVGA